MKKLYLLFLIAFLSCGLRAQDQFVAEIRIFAGNFPPKGWAFCDGQLMTIRQNTALFSLLGITYGGDGKTTFALPNLNGCTPIGVGNGPGLTPRSEGEQGGVDAVALQTAEMPAHSHPVNGGSVNLHGFQGTGNSDTPVNSYSASCNKAYNSTADTKLNTTGSTAQVAGAGAGLPHNTLQPYLVLRYIIALQGIFPPRS